MKQIYFKKNCLVTLLFSSMVFAQTPQQIEQIKKETNISKLNEISQKSALKAKQEKQKALQLAATNGWQVSYVGNDGAFYELIKTTPQGSPIYYKTDNSKSKKMSTAFFSNVTAAQSTRTNWLHNGGGLGLNVEGQGMTAYVWDGGIARLTHQEYDGIGGQDRVSIATSQGPLNFHAAHVMGTVVSSGFVPAAKGMAPQAKGIAYDWNSDESEVAQAATQGMILSNHSYGLGADNIPDSWFGAYLEIARGWDEIMFNAPYYLQVISAGNDGNNNTANGNPLDGNSLYDKLSAMKVSKNSMIVANARDANINTNGELVSVTINTGSSEGPTDDYRIKPDITGNGTGLFSTYESADDAYNTISGTSMSAPNITGSLLLLQQHYSNLNGGLMKAATLKGLALHTADDVDDSAGLEGPDAVYGWGLMNTKRAAEAITNQGLESIIKEITINQGETLTYSVSSDGLNPLLASISWTDAPGTLSSGANDPTPALVNDLDIRVSNTNDTYMPWRLTGVNSNEKGDNLVDPYERVDVVNASGEYTITITHKGTLQGGSQNLSLIVTGIISDFTITAIDNLISESCSNDTTSFEFSYRQSTSTTTNLSLENLPQGVTGSLSSETLNSDGNFTVTIENLDGLTNGRYDIDVVADNGNKTERRTVQIEITNPIESGFLPLLSLPVNESKGIVSGEVSLEWQETQGATNYTVEISKNPSFNDIIGSYQTEQNSIDLDPLESNTIYYWRVKAQNICQESEFSETFSFQTKTEDCTNSFDAEIASNSIGPLGVRTVQVNIDRSLIASRLKVNIDASHTSVGDLEVQLRTPNSMGSNTLSLLANECEDNDDLLNVVFDDFGSEINCNATSPTLTGAIKPEDDLTVFRGQDVQGVWSIIFADFINSQGSGTLNSASISVCSTTENTNVPTFTNNGADIVANGNYIFTSNDFEASTASENASDQLYTIVRLPSKGRIEKDGAELLLGATFSQADVNNGLISFVNNQTELFTDSFIVDITNGANGWLPNQTINLTATTLSNQQFEIDGLNIYPNPSEGEINIKLNQKTQQAIQVTLFDVQGRTILSRSFDNNTVSFDKKLNVRNLSNGIYLLNIREGNYTTTKRVVISK